ncbi:serine hydrolase domain-containing protein [Azohydromonas caseinilytica]|uniref:Beta-lactamase family protein n=1 Tax=Azohydromonas caseinilytica TaxID=2728836 RepID=A0A848F8I6_9BURK|nr:serine hydrolase domain-containing protein [Azohydromonas caseinilytica]NML15025.1 beta-lactamase family protein [Azohydromonas caseinilytica]
MPQLRRRTALKSLSALALAPLLPGCAGAPEPPPALAQGDAEGLARYLRERMARELQAEGVAGLSLAVVDDQRIAWAQGAGWADRERRVAATADTLYRVGSVSKLFTTAAALRLVAQGRLALDTPIQAVLPEVAIRSRWSPVDITPRLLMTHRAGLPRDLLRGMWGDQVDDFRAAVAALRDLDLAAPPGLLMSYSNLGFDLLGAAVERRAGMPFETWVRQGLLQPLGMEGASFELGLSPSAAMAQPHEKGRPAREPKLRDLPAGGLNASVSDLGRFLMLLFTAGRAGDRELLPPPLVAEMLRPQHPGAELGLEQRMGLGWMLDGPVWLPVPGAGRLAHHGGATLHYRAHVLALPEHRLGVAVAANDAAAGKLVLRLGLAALEAALQVKTGLRRAEAAAPARPAEVPMPAQALADFPGDYTTLAGLVRVRRDGERLQARLHGQELALFAGADGALHPRYALLGLIPLSLPELDALGLERRRLAGREVLVARLNGSELLAGERIEPTPLPPAWRHLAGRYVPNAAPGETLLMEAVEVLEEGGYLLARAHVPRFMDQPALGVLRPLSDTEALLLGPLADVGEVVRRIDTGGDGGPAFSFSGYRFRRAED